MDDFVHIIHVSPHDKVDWVLIEVDILEVATGRHALWKGEGLFDNDEDELNTVAWEEGNDSCDCNRAICFARALKDEALEEAAWEIDQCSEGRFAVQLRSAHTGRVIWTDPLWVPAVAATPESAI